MSPPPLHLRPAVSSRRRSRPRVTSGSSCSLRSPPGSRSDSCSCSACSPERTSRTSSEARSSRSGPDSSFSQPVHRGSRASLRQRSRPACRRSPSDLPSSYSPPGARLFDLSAWAWPVLLGTLVVWSFRGARRSLRTWSRRALVYPALLMLLVIAICGAAGAVMAAASSAPIPASGHTYIANGHRLYLNCTGTGSPTVVLFHGFGEWTPNRAWVQANVSHTTRACAFDRNVKAGAALMRPPKTAISSRPTCTPFFASRTFPGRMSLPATACARCRTRVQLLATPANRQP